MAFILYRFSDGHNEEIEVTEEFAAEFAEMEHREYLVNRKETRRHQSLDKSIEHGFDIADMKVNVFEDVERHELSEQIHTALHKLTDKQRTVFLLYVLNELSFREIGDQLGLAKNTVREYYLSAVKKLKKVLQNTLSN
ncbi:RNA polymerase sigma factor [Anaerocaecibacter muris]|uniref:RNA polymerase sigma factor n=1 Tax=Anaerocaecibacter muris TaxID=2941513 RepID=UPI003F693ABF